MGEVAVRDSIDFHFVPPHQKAMDARLVNWARYVRDKPVSWTQPMFRGYRSSEVWVHEATVPVDSLDGHQIEKAVSALPQKERAAVRWAYVYRSHPARMCRSLGVTSQGLGQLIETGRQMLINRSR